VPHIEHRVLPLGRPNGECCIRKQSYIFTYLYTKVCLRHHDLLNYRTDLFKKDIFRKFVIP
jgi:hypothetical protein